MTQADILRIYEEQNLAERNEAAEKRRLSQARANLDKKLNEEDSNGRKPISTERA